MTITVARLSAAAPGVAQSPALRTWQRWYVRWLQLTDAVAVVAAVLMAELLRFGPEPGHPFTTYTSVSVAVAAGWLVCLSVFRTRAPSVLGAGTEEYRRLWTATLAAFGCVAVVASMFQFEVARGYLALALPLGLILLTLNRNFARRYVSRQRSKGRLTNRVLAIGSRAAVQSFGASLDRNPAFGYTLVDSINPSDVQCDLGTSRALDATSPNDERRGLLAQTAVNQSVDTVALISGDLTPDEIRDLSWQLEHLDIDLVVSPGMADVSGPRLTFRTAGGLPIIHVDKPQYDGAKRFQKRAFDVCFSSLVLLAIAPVMLVVAIAIKLDSAGPVFYRAERIGLDGKPFRMIKFRSMVVDADRALANISHLNESDGTLFKIRDDPRVTRVGRFIRKYSLDELPQFINAMRGDMSVVGPRPPLRREVEQYDGHVMRRLLVRPGITGLWQISGRSDLSWEDSVRLDLSYVENWSMVADLAITVGTIRAVLRGTGAY